jgi:hypothetical protein
MIDTERRGLPSEESLLLDIEDADIGDQKHIEEVVRPDVPSHDPDDDQPCDQEEGACRRVTAFEDDEFADRDDIEEEYPDHRYRDRKDEHEDLPEQHEPVVPHHLHYKLKVVRMNIYYFIGSAILFGALALSLIAYSTSTVSV